MKRVIVVLVLMFGASVLAAEPNEVEKLRAENKLLLKNNARLRQENQELKIQNEKLTKEFAIRKSADNQKEEPNGLMRQYSIDDLPPKSKNDEMQMVGQKLYAEFTIDKIAPKKSAKDTYVISASYRTIQRKPNLEIKYEIECSDNEALRLQCYDEVTAMAQIVSISHASSSTRANISNVKEQWQTVNIKLVNAKMSVTGTMHSVTSGSFGTRF